MPRPEWGLPRDTVQLRRRRDHFPKTAQREWSENILHICNAQVNKTPVSHGLQWRFKFQVGSPINKFFFTWFAGQNKEIRRRKSLLQLPSTKLRGYRFWGSTIYRFTLFRHLEPLPTPPYYSTLMNWSSTYFGKVAHFTKVLTPISSTRNRNAVRATS